MSLVIPEELMQAIHRHGEGAYPNEGAGMLLGRLAGGRKQVVRILGLENRWEESARHNRYMIGPQDYLSAELEAERQGLEVLGIFHSHPDHPEQPSEFDGEWALPGFSYLITRVQAGRAQSSRSWRLSEDRSGFVEEPLESGNGTVSG